MHLFSGRRRFGDLHYHLQAWAATSGIALTILSCDTAVSCHYGNLDHRTEAWRTLQAIYNAGWVACTVLGTPCETFSEARFQQPPSGQVWPRPLRSADRIYGLQDLTAKELRQAGVGSLFYLQGLQVLAQHIQFGGYYLSEHPAPPRDPVRPTVWRAPLTLLMRQHPDVDLRIINQWEWHAESVKPTGLLSLRMPRLVPSMRSIPNLATEKPQTVTIGTDSSGRFRTAGLKEYPSKLSEGFSRAITDQLRADLRGGRWRKIDNETQHAALAKWLAEAEAASAQFSAINTWLPDFQG